MELKKLDRLEMALNIGGIETLVTLARAVDAAISDWHKRSGSGSYSMLYGYSDEAAELRDLRAKLLHLCDLLEPLQ